MNRVLSGFAIILLFLLLGVVVNRYLWSMIPASIYGMLFLFIALRTKLVAEDDLKLFVEFIISNLSIFFIAPAVGVVMIFESLKGDLPAIVSAIVVSTIAVVATVSFVCQFLIKRKDERDNR